MDNWNWKSDLVQCLVYTLVFSSLAAFSGMFTQYMVGEVWRTFVSLTTLLCLCVVASTIAAEKAKELMEGLND
ncbi:hypothetical protein GR7B_00204 [Vibrio phage vB_VcorM_GR7B]|nr:hypothetical protein GR7B_00204 [Vibrio phage vB_VcorM_GR7B]